MMRSFKFRLFTDARQGVGLERMLGSFCDLYNACLQQIFGGTVSESGKAARDTMLGLLKTCSKLGLSYYRFLGDRFAVPGAACVPPLPTLVRLAKA
jgi:hypothetical protein